MTAMCSYVSSHARIGRGAIIASRAVILGPSTIGNNVLIDVDVIIGYPVRRKLRSILLHNSDSGKEGYVALDGLSDGTRIGSNTIVRKGTVIYENVVIGDNVETGHNVVVRENTAIGNNAIIGTNSVIDGHVVIGEGSRIETGVYIPPGTWIGRNVFIGPRAVFTNDKYPPSRRLEGARIHDNAAIGANAVILPGVTIGSFSVVAAGSVVTKNVPPYTVVAGVPAKPVMSYEEYNRKRQEWENQKR